MSKDTKRAVLGGRAGMKATGIINSICILAAAGLAVWLIVEHRAWFKLDQENKALRRQLSRMDEVVAENQRLSDLVARAHGSPSRLSPQVEGAPATDERELVRLRGEVEALSQQTKEMETLRADTRQVRAARDTALLAQAAQRAVNSYNDGSRIEIVKAEYGTDKTNVDVAPELRERIRGGRLKAVASNNLKGDPEFGTVKRLTVVYRVGGVTMTNDFRENDFVVLPKE